MPAYVNCPQYEEKMEESHFYNFVFYEVEDKTMYVYCPNCGREHEIDLSHKSVQYVKENEDGCECFFARSRPKFLHTKNAYEKLNDLRSIGEFINDNGDAVLNVYWHTASFGTSHYDCDRPFRRYPIFDWEPVIEIRWKKDGSVEYHTSLYLPMFCRNIQSGSWRVAKRWHASSFEFNIVPDSLDNLKGTPLESWTKYVDTFVETEEQALNMETMYLDETIAAWFVKLHTSKSFRRLFSAGFYKLCFASVNKLVSTQPYCTLPSGSICWNAQKLEKILKCQLSKLDKLFERAEVTGIDLTTVQNFAKYEQAGVQLTKENLAIASYHSMDEILEGCDVSAVKMFKYLRTQSVNPVHYADYLRDLNFLNIPHTKELLFPKDFKAMHERYFELRRQVMSVRKLQGFGEAVSFYKQFNYADDKFIIKCVDSIEKLKREAVAHINCSAGYVDKILNGNSVIFVVKIKGHSRSPYCMLEYSPPQRKIVQNYTIKNDPPPQEETQFVKNWFNNIVLPILNKQKKRAG